MCFFKTYLLFPFLLILFSVVFCSCGKKKPPPRQPVEIEVFGFDKKKSKPAPSKPKAALPEIKKTAEFVLTGTPEENGYAIAVETDRRNSGFKDYTVDLEMVLKNKAGLESFRFLRARTLETQGDGDKSLIIFDRPPDIKGTALLTHSHKTSTDDQWLFLPELKRVKRITSNNKSGSFVGSEFAYEDMSPPVIEKYQYKLLREEVYEAMECFVVEQVPVDIKSGYSKQIAWLDNEEFRFHKVEYFDRKGDLLKTLTLKGHRLYLDRYWRSSEIFMMNHQTGKSTKLIYKDFQFQTGLTDRDFDRNSLASAK